jgi:phage-related protein
MPKRAYYYMAIAKLPSTGRSVVEKPVVWMGSSKRDLLDMSEDLQDTFGYAVGLAQYGSTHPDAKPMKGNLRGVTEVVADENTNTYRAMYTVQFQGLVYVLHVFQKKSKTGRATPQADLDVIGMRYKAAKQHYEALRRTEHETNKTKG